MTTKQTTGTVSINGNTTRAAWHLSPSTGQNNLWIYTGGQNEEWNYTQDPHVIETFKSALAEPTVFEQMVAASKAANARVFG